MLVPCLAFSSAASLVRSCRRFMAASPASCGLMRSALTLSSLSDASSGFQWPLPWRCFESESCLCLSNSSGLGSSVGRGLVDATSVREGSWLNWKGGGGGGLRWDVVDGGHAYC